MALVDSEVLIPLWETLALPPCTHHAPFFSLFRV